MNVGKVEIGDFVLFEEKDVVSSGTGAHVFVPKKFIGCRAKLFVMRKEEKKDKKGYKK